MIGLYSREYAQLTGFASWAYFRLPVHYSKCLSLIVILFVCKMGWFQHIEILK